ncbi:MAG: hypothetical protein ACRCZ0_08950 [Cetobacterium sp.]
MNKYKNALKKSYEVVEILKKILKTENDEQLLIAAIDILVHINLKTCNYSENEENIDFTTAGEFRGINYCFMLGEIAKEAANAAKEEANENIDFNKSFEKNKLN